MFFFSFRRECLFKISAALGLFLTAALVLHQLSYTEYFTITQQDIEILQKCPSTSADGSARRIDKTIPDTIHQIWKTSNTSAYPAPASHDSWKANYEPMGYTVKLWTDDDIATLIETNYTWLVPTYKGYSRSIQRADLARLAVIHAEGGIYADLDVHPRSVDGLICLQNLGLQGIFAPTGGTAGFSNHFFMAEQGADFLKWTLQEAKRRGSSASKWILLPYLKVFWSTGPLMLTGAFRQYAWMYGKAQVDVALLDEGHAAKVFGHAAGRSWHGPDGQVLNYFGDHLRVNNLATGIPALVAIVGLCYVVGRSRGKFTRSTFSTWLSKGENIPKDPFGSSNF
ncbi:nucleotide-diphospho-sugar transferase [Diaporthe sp. PMI_573]|nr:nucleotide-diphospho-sugar transferase [Diaporthaceae sp. PMI_573]